MVSGSALRAFGYDIGKPSAGWVVGVPCFDAVAASVTGAVVIAVAVFDIRSLAELVIPDVTDVVEQIVSVASFDSGNFVYLSAAVVLVIDGLAIVEVYLFKLSEVVAFIAYCSCFTAGAVWV